MLYEVITKTAIYVSPNAGSAAIDLSQAVVMLSDGTTKTVFKYPATTTNKVNDISTTGGSIFTQTSWANIGATEFGLIIVQDADSSCTAATPVINKGDIVVITLNTNATSMEPRTSITGTVQPEFGAPGVISFTTPATYLSDAAVVQLQ